MSYTMIPDARRPVKSGTLARFPLERAEPIDSAPREPDMSLMLFCPEQGGWHVGEWWPAEEPGKWVAAISTEIELQPTHWAYVLPAPE